VQRNNTQAFPWECHSYGNPMGNVPCDGTDINCYGMGMGQIYMSHGQPWQYSNMTQLNEDAKHYSSCGVVGCFPMLSTFLEVKSIVQPWLGLLSPGLLKLFCSATIFLKKFFLGDPMMDSLDVTDTCKRPISLQQYLYLVCQANLFRDPNGSRPIVWEALV